MSSPNSLFKKELEYDETYRQFIKETKLAISIIRSELGMQGKMGSEKLKRHLNDRPALPSK